MKLGFGWQDAPMSLHREICLHDELLQVVLSVLTRELLQSEREARHLAHELAHINEVVGLVLLDLEVFQ